MCKRMKMEEKSLWGKKKNLVDTNDSVSFYKLCKYVWFVYQLGIFLLTEIYIQIWNKNDKLLHVACLLLGL